MDDVTKTETEKIYAYALKLLLRKNYFTSEMEEALRKKFEQSCFDEVISLLKKDRYLNDESFFKDFVRWRVESGYGPYYIRQKLNAKGVHKSIQEISEVIEELEIDIDSVILEAVKKYKRTRGKKKDNFFRSCLNWLAGRGFASCDSIKILKQEVDEDESDFFEGC